MMIAVFAVIGALYGLYLSFSGAPGALIGSPWLIHAVTGGLLGGLLGAVILTRREISDLRRRFELGEDRGPNRSEPPARKSAPAPAPSPEPAPAGPDSPSPAPSRPHRSPPPRTAPAWLDPMIGTIRRVLSGGNAPVKVGVLILLVGVAALIRYAADEGWLSVSIEWRLIAIACGALAALVFAWRQRGLRPVFSLALQGGAIGILMLTTYSAVSLYSLLPTTLAFAILVALVGATGVLAVLQDARWLAVFGLVAGFAAPFAIATGAAGPVLLFSYFALLNLALAGVARYRGWALLNRLGFAFTFVLGTWWGVLSYRPGDFATIEPFLVLFYALYLVIPVGYALHSSPRGKIDVSLVFGLPLFAFPLQVALVDAQPSLVATSALVLSMVHLVLAALLVRRWQLPSLGTAHAALAIGLATLAVPFAFSGTTTALVWAVEAAALVWVGLSQRHRVARWSGLALLLLASLAWLWQSAVVMAGELPILNGTFLGALTLAAAGSFAAIQYTRHAAGRWLVNLLALWGLCWWSLGGAIEIVYQVPNRHQADVDVMFLGLTALLSAIAFRRYGWSVAAVGLVAAVLLTVPVIPLQQLAKGAVLADLGWLAWGLFLACSWFAQRALVGLSGTLRLVVACSVHATVLIMLSIVLLDFAVALGLGSGWAWLAIGAPWLVLCSMLIRFHRAPLTPGDLSSTGLRRFELLAFSTLSVGVLVSLASTGRSDPLPYLPLLNPLELSQLLALVLLVLRVRSEPIGTPRSGAIQALAALVFITLTFAVARAVHQLTGVAWTPEALLASGVANSAITLCWAVVGFGAWIAASRLGRRTLWQFAAVLLGLVLLKLLIVDRAFLSTVAGIVSFVVFGLLSIAVGYLAPAPPSRTTNASEPLSKPLEPAE